MARERLCKVCGGWHPLDAWPRECLRLPDTPKRANFPTPMMNLDTMDPVKSMADGLWYDSKSALRRGYAAAGVVEVGNEVQKPGKPPVGLTGDESKKATAEALAKTPIWNDLPA